MNTANLKSSEQTAIFKTVKTILRPLVRLLISQNITYTGIQNLLKQTYVKVAEESFKLEGKKQTDSRVSLLSGVHRADVKRIRAEDASVITEKEIKASLSAQIMSKWTGHQLFIDEENNPKPLFRFSSDGTPSFESLVLSVSKDKHPRSFIDDWLNQGFIQCKTVNNKEMIFLDEKGYVPEKDFEEKLFFAGKNIGDHLSVVVSNLENKSSPMFDRAVYYSGLTDESIRELEELSKVEMMKVLSKINQRASQLQEQDASMETANKNMHLGSYFYHGSEHDANQEKEE